MLAARGDRDLPRISVSFTLQDKPIATKKQAFVERWSGVVDCVRVKLVVRERHISGHEAAGKAAALPDALQDVAGAQ